MTRATPRLRTRAPRRTARPRWRQLLGGALLLVLIVPATSLGRSTGWTDQFGTEAEDVAGAVAADSGGTTVVGTTGGALAGAPGGASDADVFVRRYPR